MDTKLRARIVAQLGRTSNTEARNKLIKQLEDFDGKPEPTPPLDEQEHVEPEDVEAVDKEDDGKPEPTSHPKTRRHSMKKTTSKPKPKRKG